MPDVINLVSSDDEDSTERCRADMPEVISLDSPQVTCRSSCAAACAPPQKGESMRRSRLLPSAVETPDRPSPAAATGSAQCPSEHGGRTKVTPAAVTDDESDSSGIEDLTHVPSHRAPSVSSSVQHDPCGHSDTVRTAQHVQPPCDGASSTLGKRPYMLDGGKEGSEHAKQRKAEERASAKQQAEAAKRLKAQAREQARLEKEAAKASLKERKEHDKETKRKTSGKHSHENVFVSICAKAAGDATDEAMLAILDALEEQYPGQTQTRSQPVEGAITFQRFVFAVDHEDDEAGGVGGTAATCARREETAPQVIFYMRPSRLVDLVMTDRLLTWASAATSEYPSHTAPLLMVVGLDQHLRGSLGASARQAARARVDDALAQLLVDLRMGCRAVYSTVEAATVITRTTRSVAEEPYRNATSVVELYRNAKASAGRSRSYSSAMEAFFHAIPGVGESCAKTVSKAFPTLRSLAQKYKEVAAASGEGEQGKASARLLEDLVYEGAATSSRKSQRIGPKRSERIHLLFHTRNPQAVISTLDLSSAKGGGDR